MNYEKLTVDALLGQAVGDALGVPVEFSSRAEVRRFHLRDMIGSGDGTCLKTRWGSLIPRGAWSDDTSMTLASMDSFVQCGGRIDYEDQIIRFIRWWRRKEYCCLDFPFGLGETISIAIERHFRGAPALACGGTDRMSNGNGALMRILPFSLYCIFQVLGPDETAGILSDASAITHGHAISKMCCFVWTEFLRALADTASVETAVAHIESLDYTQWFPAEAIDALAFIAEGRVRSLRESDIGETGYVVDTLKSALYSTVNTDSLEACLLCAVNLGYDTDTAAAVTGTAAGILYGAEQIPERWLTALLGREKLLAAARRFASLFPVQTATN